MSTDTSFAAPQVAALAALLYLQDPTATYAEVTDQIVACRNQVVEQQMEAQGIPLAGPVDFNLTLATWP